MGNDDKQAMGWLCLNAFSEECMEPPKYRKDIEIRDTAHRDGPSCVVSMYVERHETNGTPWWRPSLEVVHTVDEWPEPVEHTTDNVSIEGEFLHPYEALTACADRMKAEWGKEFAAPCDAALALLGTPEDAKSSPVAWLAENGYKYSGSGKWSKAVGNEDLKGISSGLFLNDREIYASLMVCKGSANEYRSWIGVNLYHAPKGGDKRTRTNAEYNTDGIYIEGSSPAKAMEDCLLWIRSILPGELYNGLLYASGVAEGMTVKVKPSKISAGNKTYRLDIVADSFEVDWGDGVIDSSMEHTYADGNSEYTVQVTGVNITKLSQGTAWGNGWALTALLRMSLPNLNDTNNMFRDARNIQDWSNLALPAGLTSIGNNAFSNCSRLALTSLPAGVTSLGNNAFVDCSSLALTSLPEGLTSINAYAFRGCSSLASISLPAGLTSIGDCAFSCCSSLALTSLPAGLTSIGGCAFYGCSSLALTSLPEGLTRIGDGAFMDCSNLALTSLPEGLTSIGGCAFYGCPKLADVVFLGTPNRIESDAFGYTSANLFVPWSEGAVAGAPWGTKGTITYGYVS